MVKGNCLGEEPKRGNGGVNLTKVRYACERKYHKETLYILIYANFLKLK
jgi:hypothetical protein